MTYKGILLLSIIALISLFSFAQDGEETSKECDEVFLNGVVKDTARPQGFYNLMVINMSTKQGVFGGAKGDFSVYARIDDTIAFSVSGYNKRIIVVKADDDCQMDTMIYLESKVQEYETVEVYPIKSLEEIKKEREDLSKRETRTVTGVNVLQSPITALYERFSKKAQSKRLVAEMEHQDNINSILKELLRVYVSYDVVYLEEDQFEAFVYFLNIDEHFLKTASDYELITYIKDKLEHYKSMNQELFTD
ncbi:MAG: hypothetical protein COA32_09990 [Fluviicola sp.]|nr:MAG: hypothetical protein COA32_09990 [Fluviicola sp.]